MRNAFLAWLSPLVLAASSALAQEAPVAGGAAREGTFVPPETAGQPPAVTPAFARKLSDPAVLKGSGTVQWRPWRAEVFAEAARTDRPVLLFVTANWCHWGKVMERATFTDSEVATRLAEQFVAVRLDRDEHPDVDLRLQQAVEAVTGRRGWPLTALLTPEGQVFAGGTYFPPEDDPASGRPGLRAVLQEVARAWRDERVRMRRQAQELETALQKANEAGTTAAALPEPTAPAAPKDLLQRLAPILQGALDAKAGGFVFGDATGGDVPKFPTPRALDLCLTHYVRSGDTGSLDVVTTTLDGMLRGGVYDHLAGGFHRCSTDRWWRVPRFEKLLIQNAELATVCLHAWQVTGNARYKRAAEDTLACWTTLQDPSGTFFYGSQAGGASDLDDNDYFTWTAREFEGVLRDDADRRLARAFYDVNETGDLPATAPFRNVLFESVTLEEAARRAAVPAGEAEQRLRRSREQLLLARARRPAPALDRNVYVDGNALMAAAFIECGRALGQPAHVERGLKTLRALLKEAFPSRDREGGAKPPADARGSDADALHVLARQGSPAVAAKLLQDEAALFYACAVAFEATQGKEFLDAAEAGLQRMQQSFWDKERGGYFDRVAPASQVLSGGNWRMKTWQDTEEPAANGLAALACVRLGALTGRKEFTDRAASIVAAFCSALEKAGPYGAALSCAADGVQHGLVRMEARAKPASGNK